MFLQSKIGASIGSALLKKEVNKIDRNRVVNNLQKARSIGVFFQIIQPESLGIVRDFLDNLIAEKKKVYALAYIEDRKTYDIYKADPSLNIITRKDFNWFNKPVNPIIKSFTQEEFDILINLCLTKSLPVEFVVSLSKAKMKVGKYISDNDSSDIMIDLGDNHNDLNYLIEQLLFYLSVINNRS